MSSIVQKILSYAVSREERLLKRHIRGEISNFGMEIYAYSPSAIFLEFYYSYLYGLGIHPKDFPHRERMLPLEKRSWQRYWHNKGECGGDKRCEFCKKTLLSREVKWTK